MTVPQIEVWFKTSIVWSDLGLIVFGMIDAYNYKTCLSLRDQHSTARFTLTTIQRSVLYKQHHAKQSIQLRK